ncbi:hypothetical protein ACLOJK_002778 [Asimina triloba]
MTEHLGMIWQCALSEGLINWVSIGLSSALLLVFSSISLGVVWMVDHVVSALIRACDEVGALGSAGELLKGKISRRLMHSLLLTVVATAISVILAIEMDPTADVFLMIAAVNVVCLVILFLSVVYTLLWVHCSGEFQDFYKIGCVTLLNCFMVIGLEFDQ